MQTKNARLKRITTVEGTVDVVVVVVVDLNFAMETNFRNQVFADLFQRIKIELNLYLTIAQTQPKLFLSLLHLGFAAHQCCLVVVSGFRLARTLPSLL